MVWYADFTKIYQVDATTRAPVRSIAKSVRSIAADNQGGVWVVTTGSASQTRLQLVTSAGVTALSLATSNIFGSSIPLDVSFLASDPRDGSVWLSAFRQCSQANGANINCIYWSRRVGVNGQVLASLTHTSPLEFVLGTAVAYDGALWFQSSTQVARYGENGSAIGATLLPHVTIGGWALDPLRPTTVSVALAPAQSPSPKWVSVDFPAGPAMPTVQIIGSALLGFEQAAFDIRSGAYWISRIPGITRYGADPELFFGYAGPSYGISAAASDNVGGGVWVARAGGGLGSTVEAYTPAGLRVANFTTSTIVRQISATPLALAPQLSAIAPLPGTVTNNPRPTWSFQYALTCDGQACNVPVQRLGPYTISANRAGVNISGQFVRDEATGRANYTPPSPLPDGVHTVSATATNAAGVQSAAVNAGLTIDTQAPQLLSLAPANGARLAQSVVSVTGSFNEDAAIQLGSTAIQGTTFSFPVTLIPGTNSFTLTATDAAGNTSSTALQYHLLTLSVTSPASGTSTAASTATVTGTFTGPAGSTVTANGVAATLSGQSFSAVVPLAVGANQISVVLTSDGVSTSQSVTITRTPSGGGGPTLNAPALDPSIATSVGSATAFLYSGASPVQTGVAAGTIVQARAGVVRGKILTRSGDPLPGVQIAIFREARYGQTLSRADGMFDMAVNGGARLTLNYTKAGYLPVQRVADVSEQAFAVVRDVVMIPLDIAVTPITLGANQPTQVARGSVVTDGDGTRRATVIFPAATQATMILPDGSSQPLTSLGVRATEYTVGATGRAAMPAPLPPTSGYTYAVELSVDEAEAAGAREVRFSGTVPVYLENFIGFPVGTVIPSGFYDRVKSAWLSAPNGRVIKVLSIDAGVATIDSKGNNLADSDAQLAALGITADERARVATLYSAGATLWRVPVTHFTPGDFNLYLGPPGGSSGPGGGGPPPKRRPKCSSIKLGSIISCETQTLGEVIPVLGVPFDLHYTSERTPGYRQYELEIPLSGVAVSPTMIGIGLTVSVAGRSFSYRFPAAANQTYTFEWDGLDAYGRPLVGEQRADVELSYIYPGTYYVAENAVVESFAVAAAIALAGSRAGQEIELTQRIVRTIGGADARRFGLAGWTPTVHHRYDPEQGVLHLGSGTSRRAKVDQQDMVAVQKIDGGDFGDSIFKLAADENLGIYVGAAGSLYPVNGGTAYNYGSLSCLSRVTSFTFGGALLYVAGIWAQSCATAQGPAADSYVVGVLSGTSPLRVIAGGGAVAAGQSPQVGTSTQLDKVLDITSDRAGGLYISTTYFDSLNGIRRSWLLRLAPDERLRRVLDVSVSLGADCCGDITSMSVDRTGNLYFARATQALDAYDRPRPSYLASTLWVMRADGRVEKLSFFNTQYVLQNSTSVLDFLSQDGTATPNVAMPFTHLAALADGSILLGQPWSNGVTGGRVRLVGTDGVLRTIAGGGGKSESDSLAGPGPVGTSLPPWQVMIGSGGVNEYGQRFATCEIDCLAVPVTVDSSGAIWFADRYRGTVWKISNRTPGIGPTEIGIASSSGDEYYVFDSVGRHQRTLDTRTRAELFRFTYNASGALQTVVDAGGNGTTIERAGTGAPTAIVSADGLRTTLAVDAGGMLSTVTGPALQQYSMLYQGDGLLTRFTKPRGNASNFTYDSKGRLLTDVNAAGGSWTLSQQSFAGTESLGTAPSGTNDPSGNPVSGIRPTAGTETTVTSAQNRVTKYRYEDLSSGGTRRTTLNPDGLAELAVTSSDGKTTRTSADGTVTESTPVSDPRFGLQSPRYSSTTRLPSGLALSTVSSATVTLTNPLDPLTLASETSLFTIAGRQYVDTYTASARQTNSTTPAGRSSILRTDVAGRPTFLQSTGIDAVNTTYDARGRVQTVTQGSGATQRSLAYAYGADGFVQSVTDALTQAVVYQRDAGARVTQATHPGNRVLSFAYDANDNLVQFTPPGRPGHGFTFNNTDLESAYTPPPVAGVADPATRLIYSLDQDLRRVERPDGSALDLNYDSAGRLVSLVPSAGTGAPITLGYSGTTGQLSTLGTTDATHSFTYDGILPKTETLSGSVVAGTLSWDYDTSFRTNRLTVGGVAVDFGFDADSLLTQAGALTIARSAQHGLPTGTTLGSLSTTQTYNNFGEPALFNASHGGTAMYSLQLGYDRAGRIVSKTEAVQGVSTVYEYGYDSAGRLGEVRQSGSVVATYGFDANGNRTQVNGAATATFDNQDRLLTHGGASYAHTAAGAWASKTQGGLVTSYSYDIHGNLRSVVLPGGGQVDYPVDARNRRIGKRVNGSIAQRWLYEGDLRIAAEVDAAGAVLTRFVYGLRPNVPEYMARGGVNYRLITDHLGSVRLVVNVASGAVAQRIDYDEWGRVLSDSNPGFQPFGYAGGLYDADTGLARFGARDYDAATGRWTAKDPIGFNGGDSNLYSYVGGNPVSFVDPMGLAIGDFPPAPPGYNPTTWSQGQFSNGRWFLVDPEGAQWIAHPEDRGHWRHWDKDDNSRWPPNSRKPWPGQKKKPSAEQCEVDPNGTARPWDPNGQDAGEAPPEYRMSPELRQLLNPLGPRPGVPRPNVPRLTIPIRPIFVP